jgi:hypothetical protein
MFFESANYPFSGVASMIMGWNKLVFHVVSGEKVFNAEDASLSRV